MRGGGGGDAEEGEEDAPGEKRNSRERGYGESVRRLLILLRAQPLVKSKNITYSARGCLVPV